MQGHINEVNMATLMIQYMLSFPVTKKLAPIRSKDAIEEKSRILSAPLPLIHSMIDRMIIYGV
jgi:hypothetical protein